MSKNFETYERGISKINLQDIILSKTNLIQVVSHDRATFFAEVNDLLEKEPFHGWKWFDWNCLDGLREFNGQTGVYERKDYLEKQGYEDYVTMIRDYIKLDIFNKSIVVMRDADLVLFGHNSLNPVVSSILRSFSDDMALKKNKVLILLQNDPILPKELSSIIKSIDMPLPDEEDLLGCFLYCVGGQEYVRNIEVYSEDEMDKLAYFRTVNLEQNPIVIEIVKASKGLTIDEAERVFNELILNHELKAISEKKIKFDWTFLLEDISFCVREKEAIIRKSGYLDYYPLDKIDINVGGMDNLKKWTNARSLAFSDKAREFGLPIPKGVLLLGLPGTGKSLFAKMTAGIFNMPLIRLDIGKLFGGIVGESEKNMRYALKVLESISPCVLWVDEIEKSVSGLGSSDRTDGGTTSRVLGTFLTWLQEKDSPIFVIATANNISSLPPELLRKGRMDEIFFVDLPNEEERADILKIHLSKFKRDADKFNIKKLAEESKLFSGAELEECVKTGLYEAFANGQEDVTDDNILEAIKNTYPLAITMKEQMDKLRKWADKRAVRASSKINNEEIPSESSSKKRGFDDAKNSLLSDNGGKGKTQANPNIIRRKPRN